MPQRIGTVILVTLLFFVAGCQQSEPITDEELEAILGDIDRLSMEPLIYDISAQLQWHSPNPRNRWAPVGRDIQAIDQVSTRILFAVEPKSEEGQDFEEALTAITAAELIFETSADGIRYARGISPVSNYIIYRDYEDVIVVITMTDFTTDVIDVQYVSDWETIAIEGNLFEVR